jgi:hypothetical protein
MSWFVSSTNETESGKEHVLMFLTVTIDFPSGIVRFWSGWGDLVIGADTFVGAGELGKISAVPDRAGLSSDRKTYELTGVEPTWILESDIDNCHGRDITERFGFLNPETRQVVDTPEINWEGRIDFVRRVDGATPVIQVNAESRLLLMDRPNGWRNTSEHQQQFFPGDEGFNQIPALELKEVLWGGTRVQPGGSGGNIGPRGRNLVVQT